MTTLVEADHSAESYREHQMAIPGMDGYKAQKMGVAFSGGVELDPTFDEDLEFVNGLMMFREVKLLVTATVVKKGFTGTPGKDESPDQVGYGVGLRVHSLEVAPS